MECMRGEAKESLRRMLLALGFDKLGFAEAGPAPFGERLRDWIARGYAAGLEYLVRTLERRLDPRRVLPQAKTVLVAAVQYPPPPPSAVPAGRASVAAYALGPDYHKVVGRRLRAACRELVRLGARSAYSSVDSGPVLEKAWAHRAGIGWIGKHTCCIDPARGSYFNLGTILTDLEIEPDPPSIDRCGDCRLCLDACPTGALLEPRLLDPRRCIAYLTIEHRGEVPEELWHLMGNHIFGCDICQRACPYNRVAGNGGPGIERASPESFPLLAELAALRLEEIRARHRGTALARAKPERLLRNVALALFNQGGEEALRNLRSLSERAAALSDSSLTKTVRRALEKLAPAG